MVKILGWNFLLAENPWSTLVDTRDRDVIFLQKVKHRKIGCGWWHQYCNIVPTTFRFMWKKTLTTWCFLTALKTKGGEALITHATLTLGSLMRSYVPTDKNDEIRQVQRLIFRSVWVRFMAVSACAFSLLYGGNSRGKYGWRSLGRECWKLLTTSRSLSGLF